VRLENCRQRAVVDQCILDEIDAARLPQNIGTHQHAASGGARSGGGLTIDPGERVEHLKEENEGRDQCALGKTLAAQFYHQRGENETARLRAANEACEHIRLIDNVGIGEQHVVRLKRHGLGKLDALLLRP
jgi:hypothetical protein